jgi:murein L,D-transpeptidase YafK
MTLDENGAAIARYRIALGFSPVGDKERAGDGRTSDGRYRVSFKNAKPQFHLSLKISYPDAPDRRAAREAGADSGSDIFTHGTPGTSGVPSALVPRRDWTLGCVAVSNDDTEEIWRRVGTGTAVEIRP